MKNVLRRFTSLFDREPGHFAPPVVAQLDWQAMAKILFGEEAEVFSGVEGQPTLLAITLPVGSDPQNKRVSKALAAGYSYKGRQPGNEQAYLYHIEGFILAHAAYDTLQRQADLKVAADIVFGGFFERVRADENGVWWVRLSQEALNGDTTVRKPDTRIDASAAASSALYHFLYDEDVMKVCHFVRHTLDSERLAQKNMTSYEFPVDSKMLIRVAREKQSRNQGVSR